MKNYYADFQKVVNRGRQAAVPARSRTMKGRVQDTKDKEAKIAKNKENWKKVGQFAGNVVNAVKGVGKAIADTRRDVFDVASKVGTGYYLNKLKDKVDEGRDGPKGGGGTGVRTIRRSSNLAKRREMRRTGK